MTVKAFSLYCARRPSRLFPTMVPKTTILSTSATSQMVHVRPTQTVEVLRALVAQVQLSWGLLGRFLSASCWSQTTLQWSFLKISDLSMFFLNICEISELSTFLGTFQTICKSWNTISMLHTSLIYYCWVLVITRTYVQGSMNDFYKLQMQRCAMRGG